LDQPTTTDGSVNRACTKGKKDQTDNNVNVHALSFFTE
jgi:hypothetical protein